jgi:hypothetical protein
MATKKPLWDASIDLLIDNMTNIFSRPIDKRAAGLALSHLASRLSSIRRKNLMKSDEPENQPKKVRIDTSSAASPETTSEMKL